MMANGRPIPSELLKRARAMRHEPAPAEAKMWSCLRDRQLGGFKFRRQTPIPPYIADFLCVQVRLIVELDGDSHAERDEYDTRRTVKLTRDGYSVIRFLNSDVMNHLDAVLEEILGECERLSIARKPGMVPSPGTPGEG
jgi:adenine-specific DNA-methyltransferase